MTINKVSTYLLAGTVAAGLAASALVPAGAAAAPAAGSAATSAAGVTTKSVSAAAQAATVAYWTPARRASAVNADVVTLSSPKALSKAEATNSRPVGKPGRIAGSGSAAPATQRPATSAANLAAYPFPYTSSKVALAKYTTFPVDLNGKIFFTNNGGNYVCSGTSVGSYHGATLQNEVWTAGHCVSNTNLSSPGVFDSFAEFIPSYNGNKANYAPFGVFIATRYSAATNFLNHGDISVDEGAMEVGTSSTTGRTLGNAVGWDGFAWNQSATQRFHAFGYPAESPYTGNIMIQASATTAAQVTWSGGAGQPLIGIGNPMTGGSSGGAWDIDWTPTNAGYINGHNDYKFFSQPKAMYSPYQDSLSNNVRCFGATSC
jgi:hypothetical protein